MLEYLSVGIVLKPQGLKGEIKVKPLTDDVERFDSLHRLFIKDGEHYKELEVIARRYDKGYAFLKLKGCDTIESVEYLRGLYFWIPRSMTRILPKDSFLIADLIGCKVMTHKGEELGEITDILQTGSNDVYVVKRIKGELLIPALKKIVKEINISKGIVTVDLTDMEGLFPDED